jgi:Methyltransferase domain
MIILRSLKYLFGNPRYSLAYFLGRPDRIVETLSGQPRGFYGRMRHELLGDPSFERTLSDRSQSHAGEAFRLDGVHVFLYALVRGLRPRLLLETGVFDGTFTACFLKGMADNFVRHGTPGQVVSIDLPAYKPIAGSTSRYPTRTHLPLGCEPGWIIPDELKSRWTLHLGDARKLLPAVATGAGEISLFFHDSLHTYEHMTFEFDLIWPLLSEGACLMSHDVHWNHAFGDFVRKAGEVPYAARGFGITKKHGPATATTSSSDRRAASI